MTLSSRQPTRNLLWANLRKASTYGTFASTRRKARALLTQCEPLQLEMELVRATPRLRTHGSQSMIFYCAHWMRLKKTRTAFRNVMVRSRPAPQQPMQTICKPFPPRWRMPKRLLTSCLPSTVFRASLRTPRRCTVAPILLRILAQFKSLTRTGMPLPLRLNPRWRLKSSESR